MIEKFNLLVNYDPAKGRENKKFLLEQDEEENLDSILGLDTEEEDLGGMDDEGGDMGDDMGGDMGDDMGGDMGDGDTQDPLAGMDGQDEMGGEDDGVTVGENVVQVDMTNLVLKQDELARNVQNVTKQMEDLLKSLKGENEELKTQLSSTKDNFSQELKNVQRELAKRNPTPEENLYMQSIYSYPYNIKLTDFWTAKDNGDSFKGNVSRINPEKTEEEEMILRMSDINKDYNERDISNSF
jgi:hypothetical protein